MWHLKTFTTLDSCNYNLFAVAVGVPQLLRPQRPQGPDTTRFDSITVLLTQFPPAFHQYFIPKIIPPNHYKSPNFDPLLDTKFGRPGPASSHVEKPLLCPKLVLPTASTGSWLWKVLFLELNGELRNLSQTAVSIDGVMQNSGRVPIVGVLGVSLGRCRLGCGNIWLNPLSKSKKRERNYLSYAHEHCIFRQSCD